MRLSGGLAAVVLLAVLSARFPAQAGALSAGRPRPGAAASTQVAPEIPQTVQRQDTMSADGGDGQCAEDAGGEIDPDRKLPVDGNGLAAAVIADWTVSPRRASQLVNTVGSPRHVQTYNSLGGAAWGVDMRVVRHADLRTSRSEGKVYAERWLDGRTSWGARDQRRDRGSRVVRGVLGSSARQSPCCCTTANGGLW